MKKPFRPDLPAIRINICITLLTLAAIAALPASGASQECAQPKIHRLVEKQEASAGFFANLRGSDKSIRVRADRILEDTKARIPAENAANVCSPPCTHNGNPQIIFKAVPNMFLSDYRESSKCAEHLKNTTARPLTWLNASFSNYEEFAERFSDFSRGKGKYGEELYEKCDGSCSPQYEIRITTNPDGHYFADVIVICGHARDKDDDMFILTTELEWQCRE